MKRRQRGYKEWDRGKQVRRLKTEAAEKAHDHLMRTLFWKGAVGLAVIALVLAVIALVLAIAIAR